MEDNEDPTEKLQEELREKSASGSWQQGVALSAAIIAALAAVASLLAGGKANEAMTSQIQSSDKWSHYQAKSIKATVLTSKIELLHVQGAQTNLEDIKKLTEYKTDEGELQKAAEELQHDAEKKLSEHEQFAHGVTLFQISIAVCAISVLSRKRRFWIAGLGFALVGTFYLAQGFLK